MTFSPQTRRAIKLRYTPEIVSQTDLSEVSIGDQPIQAYVENLLVVGFRKIPVCRFEQLLVRDLRVLEPRHYLIGVAGFKPAVSTPRTWRIIKLSQTPETRLLPFITDSRFLGRLLGFPFWIRIASDLPRLGSRAAYLQTQPEGCDKP